MSDFEFCTFSLCCRAGPVLSLGVIFNYFRSSVGLWRVGGGLTVYTLWEWDYLQRTVGAVTVQCVL